jgi:hypothetical protein
MSAFTNSFALYEAELRALLASDQPTSNPTAFAATATSLLKTLKIEARMCVLEEDKKAATLLLNILKGEVERSILLGGGGSSSSKDDDNDLIKSRLQSTSDKITAQNESIAKTIALVAEIEDNGADITQQLAGNREQIERQKGKAKEVTTMANYAEKMAARMSKWWA